jgi:hypothetical protein
VDLSAVTEKLSPAQENEIRDAFTHKIKVIMEQTEDVAAAANAVSFYEANRSYFSA